MCELFDNIQCRLLVNAVKLLENCKNVRSVGPMDGSGHDPGLYLLNICELFNCSKILFAYLMCIIVTLLSVKSIEIIL